MIFRAGPAVDSVVFFTDRGVDLEKLELENGDVGPSFAFFASGCFLASFLGQVLC